MFVCKHTINFLDSCSAMLHNQALFNRKMIVRMDKYVCPAHGQTSLPTGLKGLGLGLGFGGNAQHYPSLHLQ
jgi:hypothetical protein